MVGEKPSVCFGDKTSDKAMATQFSLEYNLQRGKRGLLFSGLQDHAMVFGAQILTGKLLRHQRPDQGSAGCILVAKKCVVSDLMSWACFLVDEFQLDCLAA